MNRIWLVRLLGICLFGLVIMNLAACVDEMTEIEEQNTYRWQRYMNEDEYNKLEKGMTYIDVVKIAGGPGVENNESIYEWNDEILLTKGYQIHFEDGKLIRTEIVKRKGNSNR
ncbi:hypothetical protein [Solibacillus sp. FSL K6-1523]|uniref:hypothetical protein n=1 Tax=Solibacillus sp. FSL K6-1523 TaxID=2921471 RepID=UPI0030F9ED10